LPPDYPSLFNEDGTLRWSYNGYNFFRQIYANPLSYLKQHYFFQMENLMGHFQVGYEILPGLNLRSSFGYTTTNSNENSQVPIAAQNPVFSPLGSSTFGTKNFQTWIIEPQVEFRKIIGQGKLNILMGSTIQQNRNASTVIEGDNFINDALLGSISSAGSQTVNGDAYVIDKYAAIFGRLNYVYGDEFILDGTGRRDGSSRFGPGKQFGNFGSVGGGWIFSEEHFTKRYLPFLSYGKSKITYGTSGNDNIGNYQYQANWGSLSANNGYSYQGTPGYQPLNLYEPNFAWQVNKKLETGMELGFLKDRIFANITWFRNRCGNQLVNYELPSQTGFNGVIKNFPATVQNTGWEIQLTSVNLKTKKFKWNSSFVLTVPKNKLIAFPSLSTSSYANSYIIGKPLSLIQAVKYIGVNDTTGIYEFATSKGIPTYAPNIFPASTGGDARVVGNLDPKFYGGIRNVFSYGSFQLDLFIEFKKQEGINYLSQVYSFILPGSPYNMPTAMLSRWQKPGDHSAIEQFSQSLGSAAYQALTPFGSSTAIYSDASYMRLKTVSLSYSMNTKYLDKVRIVAGKIFINTQNLFTVTKYKGSDPETQSIFGLPPLKTIVAGMNFTF
jgi:TonB-dependent starch-binding outer membrane protein SusC